jgi:hypothetical protein
VGLNTMKAPDLPSHVLPRPHDEQLEYANWLERWTNAGRTLLLIAFGIYLAALLPAQISFESLPQWWMEPLPRFVALHAWPTGWQWLHPPLRGEALSLLGIGALASGPSLCLLGLVPIYLRRGERSQAVLCVAVAALMVLAATGLVSAGH